MIRSYLNNYKLTGTITSYGAPAGGQSTAEFTYEATPSRTEFVNKGFLEKAFSDEERSAIVKDNPKVVPYMGLAANGGLYCGCTFDSVRLLSSVELTHTDYGFDDGTNLGIESGRLGFLTDYAKLRASSFESQYKADTGYDVGMYWGSDSEYDTQHVKYVMDSGAFANNNLATSCLGVRPSITLDISKLEGLVGSGTFDDPYRVGIPTPEFTLTVGVKPGDESKGTVTGGGVGSIVHAEAIPNKGFVFDG
ncbi:MAG: DUF6273 domain-containing protein [Clostridia bacterium]|nr:DUF6273 domain-containing protein [Clostridia bacterium]